MWIFAGPLFLSFEQPVNVFISSERVFFEFILYAVFEVKVLQLLCKLT